MRIFSKRTLREYWEREPLSKTSLKGWFGAVEDANWANHNELKAQYQGASIIDDKRVVFNIHGNKFRLIVDIEYHAQWAFIAWVGTHSEYNKINVKTINT
jgi:mRNA interferase HigB